MENHCAWCWSVCSDDLAGSGDADLDRRRSARHAARIYGVELDGVDDAPGESVFRPGVYLRGRRGDLTKVLCFDGDGLCLFSKRPNDHSIAKMRN
jgi:hypothetical protein